MKNLVSYSYTPPPPQSPAMWRPLSTRAGYCYDTDEYSFLSPLSFSILICLLLFTPTQLPCRPNVVRGEDSLFLALSIRYNHNWFTKWLMNTSGIIDGSSFRTITTPPPPDCLLSAALRSWSLSPRRLWVLRREGHSTHRLKYEHSRGTFWLFAIYWAE